ncbi:ABC transporter ATP-binding protein [Nocardiopsis sp. NRRL B-16309]|uniref:ABC transporter ATP-binding protein n=1 Tax=Nocardiopsis sp. NRRL B-16309 TaxID=1519494 RepID=UPI0006B00250|nr:ATP-binding cassette domain-containing protein [Nocardiopsis sp. NRRL B-16309]KOX15499.1 ABC transporter [Nocardiopsis sp. NRRL B-16309]
MDDDQPLLRVRDLVVRYPGTGRNPVPVAPAVDGVSFDLRAGQTLALVGESGSGKSSTAAAVTGLLRPESGSVRFRGRELTTLPERELRALRPALQPVFQDPYGSLSPRLRVRDAVAEPLRVQRRWDRATGPARVDALLERVGLDPGLGARLPHELSGGQCQRVGIARALACEPEVLVLDEPVSALDASVRAGVLNLLTELQDDLGLGYLFICHDLALVRHVAHDALVLREGRIVESGPARRVCTAPEHAYTRALVAAAPVQAPGAGLGPVASAS